MTERVTENAANHQIIVFTDLDGTLLDHFSYSFDPALPAIRALQARRIPWILCSSKTRPEILRLRQALGNTWPYILENGGGIGFDPATWYPADAGVAERDGVMVKSFGPTREEILQQLEALKSDFRFRGFNQMSQAEIMQCTGLDPRGADLAGQREFTEPLLWQDSEENRVVFARRLNEAGLRCVPGGRFIHVMGHYDKARAMSWLVDAMPGIGQHTRIIALGDSDNDIGMLEYADLGVVIKSPVHDAPELHSDHGNGKHEVLYTEQPGPVGWNQALTGILEAL